MRPPRYRASDFIVDAAIKVAILLFVMGLYFLFNPEALAADYYGQRQQTLTNTYNPMESYTIRTDRRGNGTITNTYNPMESYTIRRGPAGTTITDTYNPMKSWSIR